MQKFSWYFNNKDGRGRPLDVVVNVQDCDVVGSGFKPLSRNYVHFQTNTFGKSMTCFILPTNELNSTTTVILHVLLLELNNPQRLICH